MKFIVRFIESSIYTHLTSLKGGIRSIEEWILDRRDYPLEGIIGVFIKETTL